VKNFTINMNTASKNVGAAESGPKDVQNSKTGFEKTTANLQQILRSDESAAERKTSICPKCPDCDAEIPLAKDKETGKEDVSKGEVLSCPGCGLEVEVKEIKRGKKGEIERVDVQEMTLEGEDWGE
jgi:hypothetical protein